MWRCGESVNLMFAELKAGETALRTARHMLVFTSVKIECTPELLHSYTAVILSTGAASVEPVLTGDEPRQ